MLIVHALAGFFNVAGNLQSVLPRYLLLPLDQRLCQLGTGRALHLVLLLLQPRQSLAIEASVIGLGAFLDPGATPGGTRKG